MSTSVSWNGTSYSIPAAGEVNWPSLSNFLIALGNNAANRINSRQAIRIATTSPVTVSATTDSTVVTDLGTPGAVAVNLPAGADGQMFFILDGKGDAVTNNITVTPNGAETINGAATLVMDHNGQGLWVQFVAAESDWKVLANIVVPGTITPADIVGVIPANKGGTGIANNAASTITITGAHPTTLTVSNTTALTLPTTGTLATLAGSETLSNKTITAPTVTGQLLLQNAAGSQPTLALSEDPDNGTNKVVLQAPATLASDYTLTLPSAQGLAGQVPVNDGSGNLSWGASSAGGALNLVESPSDATGWTETGSVFATPVTTTTAGDLPLGGIVDTAIQFVATNSDTEATDYNSYSFTTPASMACKLGVYVYLRPGTGFVSGEWTISIYAGSTRQSLSTDSSSVTLLPDLDGQFATTFDCLASTAYTIRFARTSGSGSATLNVANVQVTPGIQAQGAVVGPTTSYTPTLAGFGTATSVDFEFAQVGDTIGFINGSWTNGTVDGTNASITLPNSYTAVETKIVGRWFRNISSGSARKSGTIYSTAASNLLLFASDDYTAAAAPMSAPLAGNAVGGNTNSMLVQIGAITVTQLVGSGTVNLAQNNLMYVSNDGSGGTSANTTYTTGGQVGPGGSQFVSVDSASGVSNATTKYLVTWPYPVNQSSVQVQLTQDGGTTWVDGGGSLTYNGLMRMGSGVYGMTYVPVSATTGHVYFGNKGRLADSTFGADGAGWSGIGGSSTNKWRCVAAVAGQAVGFGEVAQNSSGLVKSAGQLLGTNTNDNAATGCVGELLTNTSSTISLTNNTYDDAGTITLTAGDWDVSAMAEFSGTPTGTQLLVGLGTATGNSATGISFTHRALTPTMPNGNSQVSLHLIPRRYTVANGATQVLYVKVRGLFSVSTLSADGHIQARRVR